ncbi:hypothetical protein Goshw_023301 [Gossypium schwendimanii]|uniref:Uncharacterized protein n=1 Tax=Gossypium schwendimanii TaxID=34291 RepID=A0A7J9N215_GOSSC|nr:hypothetical protein [Gossypium schwendimanii]
MNNGDVGIGRECEIVLKKWSSTVRRMRCCRSM